MSNAARIHGSGSADDDLTRVVSGRVDDINKPHHNSLQNFQIPNPESSALRLAKQPVAASDPNDGGFGQKSNSGSNSHHYNRSSTAAAAKKKKRLSRDGTTVLPDPFATHVNPLACHPFNPHHHHNHHHHSNPIHAENASVPSIEADGVDGLSCSPNFIFYDPDFVSDQGSCSTPVDVNREQIHKDSAEVNSDGDSDSDSDPPLEEDTMYELHGGDEQFYPYTAEADIGCLTHEHAFLFNLLFTPPRSDNGHDKPVTPDKPVLTADDRSSPLVSEAHPGSLTESKDIPLGEVKANGANTHQHSSSAHKNQAVHFLPENHGDHKNYIRIVSTETVDVKLPSCSGLPLGWNSTNDRFIAYLATHAPLDEHGKVPKDEDQIDRYSPEQIAQMCTERFPRFNCYRIAVAAIESRLAILDLSMNNYFNLPYGCYNFEEWGYGI